jgi:hypothetical protein
MARVLRKVLIAVSEPATVLAPAAAQAKGPSHLPSRTGAERTGSSGERS